MPDAETGKKVGKKKGVKKRQLDDTGAAEGGASAAPSQPTAAADRERTSGPDPKPKKRVRFSGVPDEPVEKEPEDEVDYVTPVDEEEPLSMLESETSQADVSRTPYEVELDQYLESFTALFEEDLKRIRNMNFDVSMIPVMKDTIEGTMNFWKPYPVL
eukprot:TRINITY_DN2934_c0_g1_i2.p1 TRINITY_DN2934_c0_g1~~TRINITY_DN2934_c0_g1_i2.p1  ORF type:complete len:175 (+),score=55.02 TRINITY_DN2934_c0_g1_i2:52-525(+)